MFHFLIQKLIKFYIFIVNSLFLYKYTKITNMIDLNENIDLFEKNMKMRVFLELKELCEDDIDFYRTVRDYVFKKEGIVLASQI